VSVPRILWSAAAALTLAGFGFRIVPPALPSADPPTVPAARALPAGPGAPTTGAGIVEGNIFSPNRTAPRVRFTARGVTPDRAVPSRPAVVLYGITVSARGALALIDADPAIPGAELYRIGDLVHGSRLTAITDSTVTLAQPSGPLVLRLAPGPRRNP